MSDLPTVEQKRRLLHDVSAAPDRLNEMGDRYRDAGRLGEALELYERTRDAERLRRLRQIAVDLGDPFVLAQTERLLREPAPPEAWRAVAEKAIAEGRLHQARTAARRGGDEARAEEIAAGIPPPPRARPGKSPPEPRRR